MHREFLSILPVHCLLELQTGKREELPRGNGPRSIQIYWPKDARQRSPMSSFIFLGAARCAPAGDLSYNRASEERLERLEHTGKQVYFTERFEDCSEATDVRVGVGRCKADNRVPIRCPSKHKARPYLCLRCYSERL